MNLAINSNRKIFDVQQGQKFAADTTLIAVSCPSCRIVYAIPSSLDSSARAWPGDKPRGWSICCPMGHSWHYTGRNYEEERDSARNALARERSRHDQTAASLRATKAAATRARNQRDAAKALIAEGICPVDGCGRQCKDLERHMRSKHPDYADRAHLPHGPVDG